MQNCVSVFRKVSFSEKDRQKWEQSQVLTFHFMSSEESDRDDEEEVLIVKPLPWKSPKVTRFLKGLDEKQQQCKTPQARRQEKRRVQGDLVSSCSRPALKDLPGCVFTE